MVITNSNEERVTKIDTYLNAAEVFAYRSTCLKRKYGAVHAEANALLNCSREQTIGADLYLTGINPEDSSIHEAKPCPLCARMIIQAGIKNVYLRVGKGVGEYKVVPAEKLLWVVGDTD